QKVLPRGNHGLAVSTVQHEVLATQLPHVLVGAACADALVAGNADLSTDLELWGPGWNPEVGRRRLHVDHAEAALGSTPYEPAVRIDQLIERVVAEVEVVVARRELVQPVVCGDVRVRIAEGEVRGADVRGADGEAQQRMLTRR